MVLRFVCPAGFHTTSGGLIARVSRSSWKLRSAERRRIGIFFSLQQGFIDVLWRSHVLATEPSTK